MKTLITFVKAHRMLVGAIAVTAIAGGGYFVFNANKKPSDAGETTVGRHDLLQEVNVTGKVRAADSVELAFERRGKVAALYADVGDRVLAGAALIALENSELRAQLLQAEASVEAEEARLAKLTGGTRPEEILIKETSVKNAATALSGAKSAFENTLKGALTKSDDAVKNKIDQFFSNPAGSSPQLVFTGNNSQLENEVELARVTIGGLLSLWRDSETAPFETRIALTRTDLSTIKDFLDKVATVVNGLGTSGSLTQTTLDGWKADASAARTNVNTALTNFIASEGTYDDAQSALTLAENELALAKAGAIPQEILAQQAVLDEARANVANLTAQLGKTSLRSPFAGIVTKRSVEVGEIATANAVVMSVISDDVFEIVANVPEADIAKIALGARARVTLDAYGDDVPFSATVTKIDPAETVIDGVSTYAVAFHFTEKDSRIRSGMTADIDIVTGERTSVLAIPSRIIGTEDGERVVYVKNGDGKSERRVVKTGLKGFDGYVEILSGLSDGEQVAPAP